MEPSFHFDWININITIEQNRIITDLHMYEQMIYKKIALGAVGKILYIFPH